MLAFFNMLVGADDADDDNDDDNDANAAEAGGLPAMPSFSFEATRQYKYWLVEPWVYAIRDEQSGEEWVLAPEKHAVVGFCCSLDRDFARGQEDCHEGRVPAILGFFTEQFLEQDNPVFLSGSVDDYLKAAPYFTEKEDREVKLREPDETNIARARRVTPHMTENGTPNRFLSPRIGDQPQAWVVVGSAYFKLYKAFEEKMRKSVPCDREEETAAYERLFVAARQQVHLGQASDELYAAVRAVGDLKFKTAAAL